MPIAIYKMKSQLIFTLAIISATSAQFLPHHQTLFPTSGPGSLYTQQTSYYNNPLLYHAHAAHQHSFTPSFQSHPPVPFGFNHPTGFFEDLLQDYSNAIPRGPLFTPADSHTYPAATVGQLDNYNSALREIQREQQQQDGISNNSAGEASRLLINSAGDQFNFHSEVIARDGASSFVKVQQDFGGGRVKNLKYQYSL